MLKKKLFQVKNGKILMDILISEMMGTTNINLEDEQEINRDFLTFTLNKNINTNKPTVNFTTNEKEFFVSSNIELTIYSNDLQKELILKPNTKTKIELNKIYKIGQTQFKNFRCIFKSRIKNCK